MALRNSSRSNGGSFDFITILTVAFVVLKLVPGNVVYESWSWWWVLSPLWISAIIVLAAILVVVIVSAIQNRKG